jgi:LysM repeat protein
MSDEGLTPFEEGSAACPFIAFEDDRDHRADRPDYRHRCFASSQPEPRALPHQQRYCLAVGFPQCPVFLDWARQEAAAVSPAGRRPSSSMPDDEAADGTSQLAQEAPAFLAGRSRQTSTDEAAPQPTRRTPEPVGDLWGYKGDVKRPTADAAASSALAGPSAGAADSAAIISAGAAGSSSIGSVLGSAPAPGASRGIPPVTPPSGPMARPAGSHPAWERPAKAENFPRLHSRDERSSNSPLLLAMVGVAILVVFLFAWPFLTNSGSKPPAATHTPTATATLATPTPTTSASATPGSSGGATVYTVQTGDTLYSIELHFNVSQEAILALNPQITDPAIIHVGDQIRIPPPGTAPSASASSSAS